MATITIHAAKTNLSKLIERALSGEEVIIARGDQPVVRLVPINAVIPTRQAGTLKGKFTVPDGFFDPLRGDDLEPWEGKK